jgi:hypothetical protein
MPYAPYILAANGPKELVPVIIFLVIWAIGALASVANKAKQQGGSSQQRPRANPTPLSPRGARVQQRANPRQQIPRPFVRPAAAFKYPAAIVQKAQALNRGTPRKPPPLPPVRSLAGGPSAAFPAAALARQPLAPPLPPRVPGGAALPQQRVAIMPSDRGPAAQLARWLTPQSLRTQVIVSEILRPPLALRSQD